MLCKYCGAMLDDDSVFCPKCGKKLVTDRDNYGSGEAVPEKSITGNEPENDKNIEMTKSTALAIIFG